jgi:streptomycin 6-kinase
MGGPQARDGLEDNQIVLPQSFLDMPRWWREGSEWLAALPRSVREQCQRWKLRVTGDLAHGSNAIAVPVTRDGEALLLRMAPPGPDVADQVRALRFWDGRGTAQLIDADLANGAMLLERLAMHRSLRALPLPEGVTVLGRMMRRLALPAPAEAPSTASIVKTRIRELEPDWHRLHRPFDRAFLTEAINVAGGLSVAASDLAVNGDLHFDQVLEGTREAWLTVDPLLLRGDIEYDLARILWTRIDEMTSGAEIVEHFEVLVREAGLARDRARDWLVFRTVDYWLWGLNAGLTEDPRRCQRLLATFS